MLSNYGATLSASHVSFTGLDVVTVSGLNIQPVNADTLLTVGEAKVNLSLLDLLTATIGFDEVILRGVTVTAYNLPERNNLKLSPLTTQKGNNVTTVKVSTFKSLAKSGKARLVRMFNTAFDIGDVHISYIDTNKAENIYVPQLKYDKKLFAGSIINQRMSDTLLLKGEVLERNVSCKFDVERVGQSTAYLPFLNRDRSLKCRFNTITGTLRFEDNGSEFQINTSVQAKDFHINHWRLANDDVVFERAQFKGRLNISDDKVELDSSSTVMLKDMSSRLYACYQIKPDTVFTMGVHMPETVSDTFFHALPQGMFNTLKGISCTGSLQYDLLFSINTGKPDSLLFYSELKKKNFGIRKYGAENYERMNGPFMYEAYDKDRFVRNIDVSPSNPMFTPLNRISDYLVKSVLQSEDPSFMLHRGFLPEAFRESIVKNYKERRFARGGSTISMQLVKNVFLSRDKTVSRKAEEALIVYLIENLRLVPKERMLEVYLNVIEWGPNVYGVAEASRFYFNKSPSELALQESIFLAGIIPAPKYFKYQFDKEGNMKSYLSGYFRILTGRMAYKGWITPVDTTGLQPNVKLTGPALKMIVPVDTVIPEREEE
ncbi:MAG TPA: biosynthetic peptidoglycan transglycosylase [Chitinophagales bacterium]|nr:biosynthetic peptidoglycan transglycosylase [Chitinophagales bacterium]